MGKKFLIPVILLVFLVLLLIPRTYSFSDSDGEHNLSGITGYGAGSKTNGEYNLSLGLYEQPTGSRTAGDHEGRLGYYNTLNVPPEARNVTLNATSPDNYTADNLTGHWTFFDPDGDTQQDYQTRWYRDNSLQSQLNDSTTVTSGNTSKGQVWIFSVRVYDGTEWSDWVNSSNLTIRNIPPSATNVILNATDDPLNRTTANLTGYWSFQDQDGSDTQQDYQTRWYRDNSPQNQLENYTTVTSGNTSKGETWIFSVRVYDGTDWSGWVNSSDLTILNTPPTHTNPLLNASSPDNYTTDDLYCYNRSTFDQDGDSVTNVYRWFKNSVEQPGLENASVVLSGNTSVLDVWVCEVIPYDDETNGTPLNSSPLTIQNIPPNTTRVFINSTSGNNYTTDNITCWAEGLGPEQSSLTAYWQWYVNGVLNLTGTTTVPNGTLLNVSSINSDYTAIGDIWNCSVRMGDGLDNETDWNNASMEIKQAPGVAWSNMTWPEGIYEPYDANAPGIRKFTFNITFQNFSANAGNRLQCDIELSNGSIMELRKTVQSDITEGEEWLNYTLSGSDSVDKKTPWYVHNCSLWSGSTLMYSNASNYGSPLNKRIHVHSNTWTRFDNVDDDAYRAGDCFLGIPKAYFNNTYYCDYAGDVAFSVSLSRGMAVETYCHDGIDNDGNGATDCDDIYCRGITYSCIEHEWAGDPFGGSCSNGICWETKNIGGQDVTYYYTRYVSPDGTLKVRFRGDSYSTTKPISYAISDLGNFSGQGKYGAPGKHELPDEDVGETSYKTEDPDGHTGDIDMVMYVNLSTWSEGEHNVSVYIRQMGSDLLITGIPVVIDSSAPGNWNESRDFGSYIQDPCKDSVDNDLDYDSDCLDADCDGHPGGTDCTGGTAYCEYGIEQTCYDCFDNDANNYTDCADSVCNLRPGNYQDMSDLCEYLEGAGYTNGTHEALYSWVTACSDSFNNDAQDNTDCYDTTQCWGRGGTSTTNPCPAYENNTDSWCHDGTDNDYDDGTGTVDTDPDSGKDCADYDCRGVSYSGKTCPTDETVDVNGNTDYSQCFDNLDNDLDSPTMSYTGPGTNIDCADPDCAGVTNPENPVEVCISKEFDLSGPYQYCADSSDNDGDNYKGWPNGGTDCTDPDCNKQFEYCGPCPAHENYTWDSCADGSDNDRDMSGGGTDCADSDCTGEIGSTQSGQRCQSSETECSDGFDNDADGNTDCADPDCDSVGYCEHGTESTCNDDMDNDADGLIDCMDSDCYGVGSCASQDWSSSCTTVPHTTGLEQVASTTVSVQHLDRHYINTNYTARFVGTGTYTVVIITVGDATDSTREMPYNATRCTLTGTPGLKWVSSQEEVGQVQHDPTVINATNPANGFDVTLECEGLGSAQSNTYAVSVTNLQEGYIPDSGETEKTATVYENTAPTVSEVEIEPLDANDWANVTHGETLYLRAIPSNDPSGICSCTFNVSGSTYTESDCRLTIPSQTQDTSYTVSARATDGASNTGSYSGTQAFDVNVGPEVTSTSVDRAEPFYNDSMSLTVNAQFRTAENGNFDSTSCSYYILDSSDSVVDSGTVSKSGYSSGSSTLTCSGTVSQPTTDGYYRIYINVTDEDGEEVSSYRKPFFVCNSLISKGTGWTCEKADFDQDGWTEGINITIYGDPNMVCDMCPGETNTGEDIDGDGIDDACDPDTSQLEIWDETDPEEGSQTKTPGDSVEFYADYSQAGNPITGADCVIRFYDGGTGSMTYSSGTYTYSRSFGERGTHNWNVTCSKPGRTPRTETDTVDIYEEAEVERGLNIELTIPDNTNTVTVPGRGTYPAEHTDTWIRPSDWFISSDSGSWVLGLVRYLGTPVRLTQSYTQDNHTIGITTDVNDSRVFLVFTEGDSGRISRRIPLIESGQFLNKISPTFGYGLGLYHPLKVMLDYSNIDIQNSLVLNKGEHYAIVVGEDYGIIKVEKI